MTDRHPIFTIWIKKLGFTPEHKFHATRRWRMDYAHLGLMIYLEVEGGHWVKGGGGHTRGQARIDDIEKQNAAVLAGWIPIICTPTDIQKGLAHQLVEKALIELDPLHRM
jgi:hypothetical protein